VVGERKRMSDGVKKLKEDLKWMRGGGRVLGVV
jgi:hypothetical protein